MTRNPSDSGVIAESNLSPTERQIWFGQQLEPEVPLYNMGLRFDIATRLDPVVFTESFQSVVDDTPGLRMVYRENQGIVTRTVLPALQARPEVIDLGSTPRDRERLETLIRERMSRVPDIASCTFDSVLMLLADCSTWFFMQHHVATDVSSMQLVYREVSDRYRRLVEGDEAIRQVLPAFPDVVNEEPDRSAQPGQPMTDPQRPIRFYGQPVSTMGTESRRCVLRPDRALQDRLAKLAFPADVQGLNRDTDRLILHATALAAWMIRVTDSTAVRIGVLMHARTNMLARKTVGPFVRMLPLDIEADERESFVSLSQKVSSAVNDLLRRAAAGDSMESEARSCHVVLNLIAVEFGGFANHETKVRWLDCGHIDRVHALRMHVTRFGHDAVEQIIVDANRSLPPVDRAGELESHLLGLLAGMLESPERPVAEIRLSTTRTHQVPSIRFSELPADPVSPGPGDDDTVVDAMYRQWLKNPDAIALEQGDVELSCGELQQRVEHLAARIVESNPRSRPVALFAHRSLETVVALLAILRSGAPFVPLDPRNPDRRLLAMIDQAGSDLVLCETALRGRAREWDRAVETLSIRLPGESGPTPPEAPLPDRTDTAYILFTSGSSGTPKGVVVDHGSLLDYIAWAVRTYVPNQRESTAGQALMASPCRFACHTSLGFDLTLTSVFVPLVCGGRTIVFPDTGDDSDLSILDVVRSGRVNTVKLTPSHLAMISGMALEHSGIHTLVVGGEDLSTRTASAARKAFGDGVRIFNEYGPTEAVVACMVHEYDPDRDTGPSVPLGRPADGCRIYLLDAGMNTVPDGVTGEIHIGGRRLATGYLGDPALTASRFVEHPEQAGERLYRSGDLARIDRGGQMVYLGRGDSQLKVRGYRVEASEVSAALQQHAAVSDCHVMLFEQANGSPRKNAPRCARCGLESAYPGADLDTSGICAICRDFDAYRHKAATYFGTQDELRDKLNSLASRKTGRYDCLMLLSGGKDSTYALHQLDRLGLDILAMTLDNGYISDGARKNIRRTVEHLGVDHRFVTVDRMKEIFADSLQRHASVCYGCFKTIYTLAINLASQEGIPAIVTGLSRGQFFETRLTRQVFERGDFDPDEIDREVLAARKVYHRVPDAVTRCLDTRVFDSDEVFEQVEFVDFYRYCDVDMDEMFEFLRKEVPWVRPQDTGRSTNCLINDTGIQVHRQLKGFHNYSLPYSWDVRLGHKTRQAAVEELDDDIDQQRVRGILEEIGYQHDSSPDAASTRSLVAYYVAKDVIPLDEFHRCLAGSLPRGTWPSRFVRLDRLPLTLNGKVDEGALPGLYREVVARLENASPAVTDAQRTLLACWQEVFRLEGLGVEDDFFELGGDSIIAVQIVTRAAAEGLNLTPNQVFAARTIKSLAEVAGHRSASGPEAPPRDAGDLAESFDDETLKRLADLLDHEA